MIPNVIFLQWFDEDNEHVPGSDTTWCEDRINDTDLVYALMATPLQMVIRCAACGMFGTPVQGSVCGNCGSTDTEVFGRIPSGPVESAQ